MTLLKLPLLLIAPKTLAKKLYSKRVAQLRNPLIH
jgi:hypothetical protein